jgi:hypothetical protein
MAKTMLAEITNGFVSNVAVVEENKIPPFMSDWVPAYRGVKIGMPYAGGVFVGGPTAEDEEALKNTRRVNKLKEALDDQNSINSVLLKLSFLQENRIRVLEGRPEVTAKQFRDWVDNQID